MREPSKISLRVNTRTCVFLETPLFLYAQIQIERCIYIFVERHVVVPRPGRRTAIPVRPCASAAVTGRPVDYTHETGGARPHHGMPRACGGGPRPGAEDGCGGAAPRAGLRGRAGPQPGLPALAGLSPAAKPRLGREPPRSEASVPLSRGTAAPRRGERPLLSRCGARTCARGGGRFPPAGTGAGRHTRERAHGRGASAGEVRACACVSVHLL